MSNDNPLTKAEEERMYGVEVTESDMQLALARQLEALDADDCASVAAEFSHEILKAFSNSEAVIAARVIVIGVTMVRELQALAQRRANFELYGKVKA